MSCRSDWVQVVALCTFMGLGCRNGVPFHAVRSGIEPVQGQELARTALAPAVPPPIARNYATKVVFEVEIKEHKKPLAPGIDYVYWTFGDDAPGPLLRVREGDLVEVHLHNHPDNKLAHDIEFDAADGPSGGANVSLTAPGHSSVFSWRALRPGLFCYQSLAEPTGVHVANGLFGLILVEPKAGLPAVEREVQIVQSEFYLDGERDVKGLHRFSLRKAEAEQPDYVVFNGRVGALTGSHALKARVGERLRVYFGNAGPNLSSAFHIVGSSLATVMEPGNEATEPRDAQTSLVPAGGSRMVELRLDTPGEYTILDHSLFRASLKGTIGVLSVEGKLNRDLFSGKTAQDSYEPQTRLAKVESGEPAASTQLGATTFANICATCHQASAEGIPNSIPPLKESDFLMADKLRSVRILLRGLKGPISVNGHQFANEMPNLHLSDAQIAAALSYVRSNFGNHGDEVTEADVAGLRRTEDLSSPVVVPSGHANH